MFVTEALHRHVTHYFCCRYAGQRPHLLDSCPCMDEMAHACQAGKVQTVTGVCEPAATQLWSVHDLPWRNVWLWYAW